MAYNERTGTAAGGAGIVGKGSATADGPGPNIMAADTLEGNTVYSSDDQDVGKIKDIMLDVSSGRIAYAVLSSGGFLGMGDKLLAIPWSALTLDTDRKAFILSVPADVVKNAPGFDKDHWPSFADASWATSLHSHYGLEPYWTGEGERAVIDQPVVDRPKSAFSEGL
ncbi:PRC-barrel domain-containing protein [Pigmentiphaga soli]|uniref:PRC-barrel domain-containing protein n=1 Tax=Pigmentiphaga soli TaxID=1007095 RepID=A0ABP8H372_9BURK